MYANKNKDTLTFFSSQTNSTSNINDTNDTNSFSVKKKQQDDAIAWYKSFYTDNAWKIAFILFGSLTLIPIGGVIIPLIFTIIWNILFDGISGLMASHIKYKEGKKLEANIMGFINIVLISATIPWKFLGTGLHLGVLFNPSWAFTLAFLGASFFAIKSLCDNKENRTCKNYTIAFIIFSIFVLEAIISLFSMHNHGLNIAGKGNIHTVHQFILITTIIIVAILFALFLFDLFIHENDEQNDILDKKYESNEQNDIHENDEQNNIVYEKIESNKQKKNNYVIDLNRTISP